MRRVFAYIRVSTTRQGERGSSLQEQRSAIEAYAHRSGLSVVRWFEEQETAAKRGRRVFNQLLRLLGQGKATGLILHKIDRGARNLRDWADLGTLIDQGVEVHFAHESLDLHSRGGRLSADIQAVVAADYIRNLRDEVRKGFYGRLKQGFYPLPAPLGYRDHGGGQVKTPDPIVAPLVRQAFELYATGRFSLITLGARLHELGLRNRRGGRVTRNGLSTILNNSFYIGLVTITKTGEHFLGKHEPLVSKVLFDRVQAVLSGRTPHRPVKHDFLYRKTLRCAACNDALIGERQKGHVYYRCHNPSCAGNCVREEALLAAMQAQIGAIALDERDYGFLAAEFERRERSRETHKEDLLRALSLQIAKLDERLTRLTDAILDGLIDRAAFEARKERLLKERLSLTEDMNLLKAGNDPTSQRLRRFLELVRELTQSKKTGDASVQRDLVKEATSNLVVQQKMLLLRWKSPFQELAGRDAYCVGAPLRAAARTADTGVASVPVGEALTSEAAGVTEPDDTTPPLSNRSTERPEERNDDPQTTTPAFWHELAERIYRLIENEGRRPEIASSAPETEIT